MRRLRDLLCGLALVASTAISLWGAVLVARQEFPDPLALEPVDLRQWLTQRDLSQASAAVRNRVARRFEEELRGGGNLAAEFRSLDPQQRKRLEENLLLVLEHWFHDKMNRYFEQQPDLRAAWLDQELEQLEQVVNRARDGRGSPLGMPSSLYIIGMIGSRVEEWIQRADPEMQERMREFQRAVQQRVLARQLRAERTRAVG
jgi:hypothetical protein